MQFTISDRAAIVFAEELFTSLIGRQYPIDAAVSEARKAVFTEVNEIEWATPVLFLRTVDGQLFDFAAAPAVAAATPSVTLAPTPSGPARRASGAGPHVEAPETPPHHHRRSRDRGRHHRRDLVVYAFWPDDSSKGRRQRRPRVLTCAGDPVPTVAWQQSPPADSKPNDLAVVQRYLDLVRVGPVRRRQRQPLRRDVRRPHPERSRAVPRPVRRRRAIPDRRDPRPWHAPGAPGSHTPPNDVRRRRPRRTVTP